MYAEVVDTVNAVLRLAADTAGDRTLAPGGTREGADGLRRSLDAAEAALVAQDLLDPADRQRSRLVINEIGAVRLLLSTYELDRRRDCMATLQGCLQRMRTAATVDELAAQAPGEVASLGFGRALFSWVDQARWVPVAFHTAAGPEEARAVMEAGSPPYWHTRDLLEAEMIRHRRSMLVRDALGNPHVHLDIQAVMQSRSYVAAPILRDTSVIGFVHADQSLEAGQVDEFDRDLLSAFAEGLGLAIDRLSAQEELAQAQSRATSQATALRELAASLEGTAGTPVHDLPAQAHQDIPREAPRAGPRETPRAGAAWEDGLTRREEQVLHLLADGRSNVEIAARLYITESTAKTHVKHVLRKLGATNRAQAAALFLRAREG